MRTDSVLFLSLSDSANWDLERNVGPALDRTVGRVSRYPYRTRLNRVGFVEMQRELLAAVESAKPDFVLWPVSDYEIHESTLARIRTAGIPIVAWFFDDPVRFDSLSVWAAPFVDVALTTDSTSLGRYAHLGVSAIYCPPAANAALYAHCCLSETYDVSFVGRPIADRANRVRALRAEGLDVRCFGDGWGDHTHLDYSEVAAVFAASRVNLNWSGTYANPDVLQLKARPFEVTMAGGFLLTESAPGLDECFVAESEVSVFSSAEECAEKARYFLTHEQQRREIAERGCGRARREHTWNARFESVVVRLGAIDVEQRRPTPHLSVSSEVRELLHQYHERAMRAALRAGQLDRAREEAVVAGAYGGSGGRSSRLEAIASRMPRAAVTVQYAEEKADDARAVARRVAGKVVRVCQRRAARALRRRGGRG